MTLWNRLLLTGHWGIILALLGAMIVPHAPVLVFHTASKELYLTSEAFVFAWDGAGSVSPTARVVVSTKGWHSQRYPSIYEECFVNFATVPIWVLFALVSIPVIVRNTRKRHLAGHCKSCNYNLTGNVSGICPECGTPVKERKQQSQSEQLST